MVLALGGLLLLGIAQRGSPEIVVERNLVYGRSGDTDLLLELAMPKTGDRPLLESDVIAPFLGGSIAEQSDTYRKASPYNYVTKDA